eukprot:6248034-Amphidinium_carterae.1
MLVHGSSTWRMWRAARVMCTVATCQANSLRCSGDALKAFSSKRIEMNLAQRGSCSSYVLEPTAAMAQEPVISNWENAVSGANVASKDVLQDRGFVSTLIACVSKPEPQTLRCHRRERNKFVVCV